MGIAASPSMSIIFMNGAGGSACEVHEEPRRDDRPDERHLEDAHERLPSTLCRPALARKMPTVDCVMDEATM